jgi:NAD(P)-dependent dehydrogenase (short-subunit alcohol dehydrogenase family)
MSYCFKDKIILITGGNSGIGLACVKKFHALGARIIATGRKQLAEITNVSANDKELLQKIDYQVCDVANPEAIISLFNYIKKHYARLDAAVNNAGIVGDVKNSFTEYSLADYEAIMNINVRGLFLCMQHELGMMLPQKAGSIINLASVAGLKGSMVGPIYGMSKFAVNGLTRSVALEYAKQGIRINAVCPGLVFTPLVADNIPSAAVDRIAETIPMGRVGQPKEIANFIAWLSSDEAAFITGSTLPIDGGAMA